jgi:transposase
MRSPRSRVASASQFSNCTTTALLQDNKISGAKIIGKGRLPTNNRATNALKMAATSFRLSNTYLGAQFRRLRTRLGAPVAIKAMAARLSGRGTFFDELWEQHQ